MKIYRALAESIRSNLTPKDRRKGAGIIALMVFNAVLDFFTVAAFLPLMASVIDPDLTSTSLIKNLYTFFGFNSHGNFIVGMSVAIAVFVLAKNHVSIWIAAVKARYAFNLRKELASRALSHYLQASFLDFTRTDFTRTLHTITNHPLAFANNIIISITTVISETLVVVFFLGFMAYYDYKVLLMIALILLPVLGLVLIRKDTLKKISHDLKSAYPLVLKFASQAIDGFVEIKTYEKAPYFYQRFERVSKKLTETFIKDQILQAGTRRLTEIILVVVKIGRAHV